MPPPRARTGESAVALSQHGMVAPVTIHHRVDFAASMIDGRTVGEVVPNCASAREIREVWLYLQERLSRVVHDPALLPAIKPEHFAINSLLEGVEEGLAPPPLVEAAALWRCGKAWGAGSSHGGAGESRAGAARSCFRAAAWRSGL